MGLDAFREGLQAEDAGDGLPEMAGKVGGLEADEVGGEDALEELLADGETAEYLRRGEGDVQEEADRGRGEGGAHERRHQKQVVVVDPDYVMRSAK